MSWQSVSFDSIKPGVKRRVGHAFGALRGLSWPQVCKHCGLCYLKNARTEAAVKAGCEVED